MPNLHFADPFDRLDLFASLDYGEQKIIGRYLSSKPLQVGGVLLMACRFRRCLALLFSRKLRRITGILIVFLVNWYTGNTGVTLRSENPL